MHKITAAAVLVAVSSLAMAGPLGGQVTAGTGSISQSGTTTTINQASQNLSLNWQSFNTSSGETVNFVQPSASAIAVNRINDTSATQFFGNLNANGQVYLVNPNGILFGAGSQVNVGGMVASTLDISEAALGSTSRNFNGVGAGSIINKGTINAANGGYVAFLGKQVTNNGTITTPRGTTALAAGSDVTLSFAGNSLVNLQVNQSTVKTLAENGGLIRTDGGAVIMTAGARDAVLASVVNNTGIIQARSVQNVNGTIVLEAGANGTASSSGTLDTSGKLAGEIGGTVKVLGETVNLSGNVDASGDAGGGTVLGGGNYQGLGTEQNAKTTMVSAGTTINADAIRTGNGGKVVVWSDDTTHFNGSISAQGGQYGGNGGAVETSGKQMLKVGNSASVSTRAPQGTAGDWLLDPQDLTIGGINPGDSDIDAAIITAALQQGNVTIKTGATVSCVDLAATCPTGHAGNGDIILVNDARLGGNIWTANTTLTLSAYRNIELRGTANIDVNQGPGNIVLRADNTGTGTGTAIFSQDSKVYAGTGGSLTIYYNPTNGNYSTPTDFLALRDSTDTAQIFNGYGTSSNPLNFYAYMLINMSGSVANKTYDGTRAASVTGLQPTYALSGVTISGGTALFDTKDAGTSKTVTITGVTANGSGVVTGTSTDGSSVFSYGGQNYFINGLTSKTANINKATLTLSGTQVYDGTTTVKGSTLTANGVAGETFTISGSGDASNLASKNVQTSSTLSSVTGLTLGTSSNGGLSTNYSVLSTAGSSYSVTPKGITLSGIRVADKVYDATTAATLNTSNVSYSGMVTGDVITLSGSGTGTFATKDVGANKTVIVSGYSLSGSDAGNYVVAQPTGLTATISKADLVVTGISTHNKTYDGDTTTTLTGTGTVTAIGSDRVMLADTGTANFTNKNTGTNKSIIISGYSLTGADSGNYNLAQPVGLTADITQADLNVAGITAANKPFDGTTAATVNSRTATLGGLLAGDHVALASTGVFTDAAVGTAKTVNLSNSISGMDSGNYRLIGQTTALADIVTAAPPVPKQAIQYVVTQVQSTIQPPQASVQPQALDLSPTFIINQPQSSISSSSANESQPSSSSSSPRNTTTAFGTQAPTLSIQNGGVQLPPLAIGLSQ